MTAFYNSTTSETMLYSTDSNQNSTYPAFVLPFDDLTVTICAVFLITFLVFGFFGNLLTMLVIITSKKLKNVFNQFILSLCVSDLVSALISWINLYRRTWGFETFHLYLPNFLCLVYWGGDMWTSYVTAQHILSFAILRLLSVWKPVFFAKITERHATIWISTIWFVAFLCGFIPFSIFSGAKERDRSGTSPVATWPSCTQNVEWLEEYSLYTAIAYPIFLYVPLVAIALASIAIAVVMLKRRTPEQKSGDENKDRKSAKRKQKEKQAIVQLALIVGSFAFGYLPFTIFEFYIVGSTDKSYATQKFNWLTGTLQYMCLRFSECLNPVFYNLASSKMRKETVIFLKRFKCKCVIIERERSESVNSSGTHSGLPI